MLANRIIKQLRNIPKGIYRVNCTPVNHEISTKYQWDDIMVNMCYHRANNEWTEEQRREIKNLLRMNELGLVASWRQRFMERDSIYESPYHKHTWLSGSQFILDDFLSEVQWILKENSLFEETKEEVIEKRRKKRVSFEERYLLCIDKENFPEHHIWWKTAAQESLFDELYSSLDAVLFDVSDYFSSWTVEDCAEEWKWILEQVCIHRLAHKWTPEEKGKLQSLLSKSKPKLVKYTRQVLLFENQYRTTSTYDTQKILSGLQFLLDDFSQEMHFLHEEEDNLEEAKGRFERLAKEDEDPYGDDERDGCSFDCYESNEAEKDEILVLNRATKPPNHTWWNIRLKEDYEEGRTEMRISPDNNTPDITVLSQ